MEAAIYYGSENICFDEKTDPRICEEQQILVVVSTTSVCGSGLHLYYGAMDPMMERGHSQADHKLIARVSEVGCGAGKLKRPRY